MALKDPRRRKLTKFVPDHVLGHENGDMAFAVVNPEGQPDHIRRDRRTPRPGLDRWWLLAAFLYPFQGLYDAQINERPFF